MLVRNWVRNLASLAACGAAAAALAYGSANLNPNAVLRSARPSPAVAGSPMAADGTRSYIVRFTDAPLAGYKGGVAGLSATNPRVLGRRTLDVASGESVAYLHYLADKHADFLEQAGNTLGRTLEARYTYSYAFNGMALRLTPAEAASVESLPGVQYVQPDRSYKPVTTAIPATAADTEPSRAWIGADTVWAKPTVVAGASKDNEGEGIVVADLDTGLNERNSSFAATGTDNYTIPNLLGSSYLGVCNPANGTANKPNTYDSNFSCNSKLIGAYTYTRYGSTPSNDPNSPEDSEGHGSHTASTAAGDFTSATSVSGISSPLSGVAPHANLIVYDVCDPKDSCAESASIAAADQAIQDQSTLVAANQGFKGMVMNFSIGGSNDPYLDPVEQAFFQAEQAGIYVSVAGGNSGPQVNNAEGYGPVEHLGPWVATIAAATDDSEFGANTVGISGGAPPPGSPFNGEGTTAGYGPVEIVYAKNHPYTTTDYASIESSYISQKYSQSGQAWTTPSGNPQNDAAECLFPFKAAEGIPAGAIVVCDRGSIALVDKADNVKQGGAGGVVIVSQLVSGSSNPLIAESYDIPGTMVDNTDGTAIEGWLGSSDNTGLTATLSGSSLTTCASSCSGIADQIAAFSSRGPNNNVYDNVLKPDLAAPGVQILAAVADPCYLTATAPCSDSLQETFDFYDGTSMATPHDTGAAALMKELHSNWTPMEIKSALMSTAVTGMGDQCSVAGTCTSTLSATPNAQTTGAGRLNLTNAARAGFVMDEGFSGQAALMNAGADADAATLQGFNLASLADNSCIFSCSWTRTVTATQSSATLNYTVTTSQSWLTVSANGGAAGRSAAFTLVPRGTAKLTFKATMTSGSWNQWLFAQADFSASGSLEDDSAAPPAQHFPVAVFDQQPEPAMSATPAALSAVLSPGGAMQTQTLTLSNSGQATLNWSLSNVAGTTTTSASAAMGAAANPRTEGGSTAAGPVVSRNPDGSNGTTYGYPSSVFTRDGHGIYQTDRFPMAISGSITGIVTSGFTLKGTSAGSLADATQVSWYVYADSNGMPAGNPEDGKNDALWTFSAAPNATGVNTSDGNDIALDIAAAGAPALTLSSGSYWLVVAPTFDDSCGFTGANLVVGGCSGEAWYWDESAPGSGVGSFIDPGNLARAGGSSWSLIGPNTTTTKNATGSVSLSFLLEGMVNCSGGSPIPGVTLSPTSGSLAPGGTAKVTATFDPSALRAGTTYNGGACIQGNDPNTPFIAVPVTETVSGSSGGGGGGGGGGGFGLGGLLGLVGLAALRRRRA